MVNYKNILTILSNAPALPLQDVANVGQSLAIHAQITIANTRRASDLKRRSIGLDDQVVDERLSSIDVAKKRLKSQTYTNKVTRIQTSKGAKQGGYNTHPLKAFAKKPRPLLYSSTKLPSLSETKLYPPPSTFPPSWPPCG